jgi:uncharacterized protein YcfJ
MNRIAIASVLAAAAAGMTAAQADTFFDSARVRSAEPQYEQVTVPREQCSMVWVNDTRRVDNGPSGPNIGGLLIGGVAGGILGNQVGKGSGRDAATAAGAVVGALAGNHIAGNNNRVPQYATEQRQVQQCHTVNEVQQRVTGYRVAYDYRGQVYTTFMREQPGRELQVRVSVDPVVH